MKHLIKILLLIAGLHGLAIAQPTVARIGVIASSRASVTPLIIDSLATQPYDVWALRKVVSTYTGNAITIRRSSDNTETDIGFTGNDLNTTALSSFCSGTNCFIKTWYGQKGTANLTQTTTGNQPRIVSSGTTEVIGSKPAIRFLNSSSTYLTLAYIGTTSGATFGNAVYKGAASPTSTNGPIFGDFGTDGNPDHWPYSDGNVYDGFARGNRLTVGALSPALTSAGVLGIVSETSNYNLYTNNTSRYSSATGTSAINTGGHRIGSSSRGGGMYWDGHLAELTLFKATPSSGDRTKLYRSQGLYYTITIN